MDDNSQNNQGSSDEQKIEELEQALDELEKQKKPIESLQGTIQDNKDKDDKEIEDEAKPGRNVTPEAQINHTTPPAENFTQQDRLTPSRKTDLLYYTGIALMISSLALLVLNVFLKK